MTVDELNFFQTLGYKLTKASYFFKDSMSLKVDHLEGLGVVFFVAVCLLSAGQLIVSIMCYNKYASIESSNYSGLKFELLFRRLMMFVIILLPLFIDLCLSVCIAIIGIQAKLGGFIIFGLIYIIIRGIGGVSADQEDGSGFGITRSIASFFGETFKRNKVLKDYKKLYDFELNRSNNLWAQIKQ